MRTITAAVFAISVVAAGCSASPESSESDLSRPTTSAIAPPLHPYSVTKVKASRETQNTPEGIANWKVFQFEHTVAIAGYDKRGRIVYNHSINREIDVNGDPYIIHRFDQPIKGEQRIDRSGNVLSSSLPASSATGRLDELGAFATADFGADFARRVIPYGDCVGGAAQLVMNCGGLILNAVSLNKNTTAAPCANSLNDYASSYCYPFANPYDVPTISPDSNNNWSITQDTVTFVYQGYDWTGADVYVSDTGLNFDSPADSCIFCSGSDLGGWGGGNPCENPDDCEILQ